MLVAPATEDHCLVPESYRHIPQPSVAASAMGWFTDGSPTPMPMTHGYCWPGHDVFRTPSVPNPRDSGFVLLYGPLPDRVPGLSGSPAARYTSEGVWEESRWSVARAKPAIAPLPCAVCCVTAPR